MGSNKGINYFLELNDHSIGVARTSSINSPPSIEHFREACLDDAASVKEAIETVTDDHAGEHSTIHFTLRPKKRFFDFASAENASHHKTMASIEDFVAKSISIKSDDTYTTAIYAKSGQPVDGSSKGSWFAATTTKEAAADALGKIKEWNLKSDGFESASISLIGAVQASLKAGKQSTLVICWDIGEKTSDLFLIGLQGIESARRLGFGYDQIAEAIQAEIQLKFTAAAAKLFFNERYNFATIAAKIGKRVATLLEPEVTKLGAECATPPTEFFCAGLPTKQEWFSKELAASMQMKSWSPDLASWSKQAGLALPDSLGPCSPSWLGLFGFAAAHVTNNFLWHPLWDRPNMPISVATTPAVATKVESKPVNQATAHKAPDDANTAKQAPQKNTPPTRKEPVPIAGIKAAKTRKVPGTGTPPWVKRFAIAASCAVLLGGGFFYIKAVKANQRAALEAQRIAERHAAADAEARRDAELKALAEAEARLAAERESAAKAAAAKAAAEKASKEEARLREIEKERLLNARGSVEVTTIPAGAIVTVGNLAPASSPASFDDLRLGRYTAEISMDGYDSTTIDLDIKEEEVTNIGPIRLVRQVGTLVLDVKPAGLHYNIRPASNELFVSSSQKRIGVTPHTIKDLPTDEYIVSVERDGSPAVTQNVVIENGETTIFTQDLSIGTIVINSDPSGAEVIADGESLGTTPLTLTDLKPGDVTYTLNRDFYHPATISGSVIPEQTTNLFVEMESVEPIAKAADLDRKPELAKGIKPTLPNPERFAGQSVVLSVTISDDGKPADISVAEATDEELALYCVDAVSQWKFRPGKIGRKAVWTRVKIPFNY